MTPIEKAKELFDKMEEMQEGYYINNKQNSKNCALIAVDEIIDAIDWHEFEVPNDQLNFWFKVKQEIEKL